MAETYYSGNYYLNNQKMRVNAQWLLEYFTARGWTKNAICGMLGNMQRESTINPGIHQNLDSSSTSGGYGLVQWTPKTNYFNWCDEWGFKYSDMESNVLRIEYELTNGLQYYKTDSYPLTFEEFTKSHESPEYLASAFLHNYERAGVSAESERQANARYWYDNLSVNYSFTPRLNSDGMEGSFYWYSENPFYQSGYGLPNCTCYAWGRFWEISDSTGDGSNRPTLPTGDAGTWFHDVSGYETGSTPRLGAVICWSDNSGGAGHVAIVEEILANGDIVVSQSGWGSSYFWTSTVLKSNNYNTSGYTFQGFIYNPHVQIISPDNGDSNKKKKNKFNFILFNKRRRFL